MEERGVTTDGIGSINSLWVTAVSGVWYLTLRMAGDGHAGFRRRLGVGERRALAAGKVDDVSAWNSTDGRASTG